MGLKLNARNDRNSIHFEEEEMIMMKKLNKKCMNV